MLDQLSTYSLKCVKKLIIVFKQIRVFFTHDRVYAGEREQCPFSCSGPWNAVNIISKIGL